MKLLIGGIIALLCVQTIYSSSSWSKCDKNLTNRKKDIGHFMEDFEKQYKKSRDQYLALKQVCVVINYRFKKFTDGCHQNPHDKECQIEEFLDSFFELRVKAVEHLTNLIYECVVMFNMADEFKCENKFACIFDKTATGCEKTANALDCNLIKFVDYVKNEGVHGRKYILEMLSLCDKLDEVARQFSCEYSPICNEGDCSCRTSDNNENLLAEFEEFHTSFGSLLDVAHKTLSDIGQVCDATGEEIDEWKKTRVSFSTETD